jgi:hypothetical protein
MQSASPHDQASFEPDPIEKNKELEAILLVEFAILRILDRGAGGRSVDGLSLDLRPGFAKPFEEIGGGPEAAV